RLIFETYIICLNYNMSLLLAGIAGAFPLF
ncbi:MAG: hypothetical protein ACI8RH_000480, partial [Flavobacteriales bacterium]